ncbi:hypothetical protein E6O75_ATG06439 [Venturia nashicola]|uniref:Uncharacterized protein n=1 Tax=Venturia nashicola TaxID=86259 RepID=A0A4Z1NXU7_9PEZI|nr:hypothetical protein E6O75_ATG06439 [Venturia nashicola]
MNSLKRILNDDELEPHGHANGFSGFEAYDADPFNNNPLLSAQTWPDVWSTTLDAVTTQFDHDSFATDSDGSGGIAGRETLTIENDIESWYAHWLPDPDDFSPPRESITSTPTADLPEILCYGMVYRTSVKVVGDMLAIDAKLKTRSRTRSKTHQTLQVKKDNKGVILTFPDGTDFGILNIQATKALEDVISWPSIRMDAFVDIEPLRATLGRATKAADAKTRVNINIYGDQESSQKVGKRLSQEKIYLQKPDHRRSGSAYDNPHIISFPNLHVTQLEVEQDETRDGPATMTSVSQFEKTVSQVYASLKRGANLQRIGGSRLSTILLQHQEEALDFMLQRENGPIPPVFSLWKPLHGEEGWFRHAVTKRKSRIPSSEIGGGILADEMGMGKTLSILSLIAKTIDDAHDWVSEETADAIDSVLPSKKRSAATLVIVPSALLINTWEDEIEKHLDGSLKKMRYHGLRRKLLVSQLEEVDIIVTTYHTLVADCKDKSSPLHKLEWFRLPPAHIIRRPATTFHRTVSDLSARSRWCLTGTPIQNRLVDIGALFSFIRAQPFESLSNFKRYISTPFDGTDERRATASQALTLLVDALCLRRTKDLLHLPPRHDQVRELEFTVEERYQYDLTKSTMNRALRQRVGESYVKSRFGMFQVQLQLRMLCNHGTFQHPFSWAKRSLMDEKEDAICTIGNLREVRCSACRQCMPVLETNNIYRTDNTHCGHMVCPECLGDGILQSYGSDIPSASCPLCLPGGNLHLTGKPRHKTDNGQHCDEPYFRPQGQSSKMDALMSDVRQSLDSTKSIIFSSWTHTLDLVAIYLDREAIPFHRIDGECPLSSRQKILDDFATSAEKPVLIMTTGTGAFGLNLTSANRVFLVEPQWNPSVENQAIARAQRLGQEKSVLVTRYVMKKTVEEEMRIQQEHKLRIAELGNTTQEQDIPDPGADHTMADI